MLDEGVESGQVASRRPLRDTQERENMVGLQAPQREDESLQRRAIRYSVCPNAPPARSSAIRLSS